MAMHCEHMPAYTLRCDSCGTYSQEWRLSERDAIEAARADGWTVDEHYPFHTLCDECAEEQGRTPARAYEPPRNPLTGRPVLPAAWDDPADAIYDQEAEDDDDELAELARARMAADDGTRLTMDDVFGPGHTPDTDADGSKPGQS